MGGLNRPSAAWRAMSLSKDGTGVSEIVGALLLVVVVSSAVVGFGMFVSQQAKLTQEQKALEGERKLEVLEVTGLAPVADDFAGACALEAGAADWNSLTILVTSRHLKESELSALRVNGLVVKFAKVGATVHDFSLLPGDPGHAPLLVPARTTVAIVLENVADDTPGCVPAYSFFQTAPLVAAPLPTTGALDIEVLTARGNNFPRAFIPPSAIASLEPTPGVADSYTLVGTRSLPGSEGAYLVKWTWEVFEQADAAGPAPCSGAPLAPAPGNMGGHRLQIVTDSAEEYCVRLTVTDNDGLSASSEFSFDP